jgi:hypothetical protein
VFSSNHNILIFKMMILMKNQTICG